MERIKKDEKKIRWKNTGGGNLYLRDKRKIVAGQIFLAFPHEISMGFRDTIKPLEDLNTNKEDIIAIKSKYTLQKRGVAWWDIIDGNGKIVNTKGLKKAEAEEMIKNLEGE
jgi:hypothetical protein